MNLINEQLINLFGQLDLKNLTTLYINENDLSFINNNLQLYLKILNTNKKECNEYVYIILKHIFKDMVSINQKTATNLTLSSDEIKFIKLASKLLIFVPEKKGLVELEKYIIKNKLIDLELKIKIIYELILENLNENSNVYINFTFDALQIIFIDSEKFESQKKTKLINELIWNIYNFLKNESNHQNIMFNLSSLIDELDLKKKNIFYIESILDFLASLICNEDFCKVFKNQIKQIINSKQDLIEFLFDSILERINSSTRKKSRFIAFHLNIISETDWEMLETLEEKQIHLIKPLFDIKLNSNNYIPTDFNKKNIFQNSLELILKRMFDHDNKFIRRYTLLYISDICLNEKKSFLISERFILHFVFSSLQDNTIYGEEFSDFSLEFLKKISFHKIINRLIELEDNISLFGLYYITRQLFFSNKVQAFETYKIDNFCIAKLFMINQKVCFDPLIRVSIQIYTLKFLIKNLKDDLQSYILFLNAFSYINLKEVNLSYFNLPINFHKFYKIYPTINLDLNNETIFKGYLRYVGLLYINHEITKEFFFSQFNNFRQQKLLVNPEILLNNFVQIIIKKLDQSIFDFLINSFEDLQLNENFSELIFSKCYDELVQNKVRKLLNNYLSNDNENYDTKLKCFYLLIEFKKLDEKNLIFDKLMLNFTFNHKYLFSWKILINWVKFNNHIKITDILKYFSNEEKNKNNFLKILISQTPIDFNKYLIKLLGYLLRNEILNRNQFSTDDCVISNNFFLYCSFLLDACLELKKKEFFKDTFRIFICEFIFREELFDGQHDYFELNKQDSEKKNILIKKIFSFETLEIKSILLDHLYDLFDKKNLEKTSFFQNFFLKFFKKGILFTRKTINLIDVLKIEISQSKYDILPFLNLTSSYNYHKITRLKALTSCIKLNQSSLKKLIEILIEKEKNCLSTSFMRNFPNSISCRIQTKIWQFILLVSLHIINNVSKHEDITDFANFIYDYTLESIKSQTSSQLSVRLIQQLTMIIFLKDKKNQSLNHLYKSFYKYIQFESENNFINDEPKSENQLHRVGYFTSFLTIVYHLINSRPKLKFFPISCLLCCHHYKVRLFSHLILIKYNIKVEIPDENSKNKFFKISPVPRGAANFSKNLSKLSNDWFYNLFNIENDLDLNFIFNLLPKLTSCLEDDNLELEILTKYFNESFFKIFTQNESLINAPKSSMFDKKINSFSYTDTLENDDSDEYNNVFQKKYVGPTLKFNQFRSPVFNNLIICASLIDRAPNLGGLCRTSEVFGIKKLIIPNSSFIKDKDFLQLSVSAHKWMNLEEVNLNQLVDYLKNIKKMDNYSLIGIEQSTKSVNLKNFVFPEKSLILLGNEKEGLPMELLQMMDYCVEIPQAGFIRSLNVHVTGALIAWEYFKQFM